MPDERQIDQLIEQINKLTTTGERLANSVAKFEELCVDVIRKWDEDRDAAKERQKIQDAEHEEFKERQKKWDDRDNKWYEKQWWQQNPWSRPEAVGRFLLMVAFAAIAIAAALLARH